MNKVSKSKNISIELNLRTRGWGIHFDEKNLYLTAIHNKLNQVHYKGYEVLEDYVSKTDEEIMDFIDEFQSRHKVKRGDTYLALPRSELLVQVAEFPIEAKDNIEEVMEYQLENYFAGNLEESDFFPQVIHKGEQLKVMIVAVKKEKLGHAFGFIRRWKLNLSGVTVDTFALVNGMAKTDANLFAQSKIAVFRPHPTGLEMIVLNQGRMTTSHYFEIGEDDVRDGIVENLEQGFSQARLDPNEIDHYLWAGDRHEALKFFLTEEVGFPFETWSDIMGTPIDEAGLTGFGCAVCAVHDKPHLALNMLPDNLRKRQKRLPLILANVALIVFALFFVVGEVQAYRQLSKEATRLEREHGQVMGRMLEVSNARSKLQARQEELTLFKRFQTSNLLVKLLYTLSQELPDNTYLTHVQVKNGNDITVQGESDDPFEIQKILTGIAYLKNVKPGNAITSGRNRDGKRRFMYKAVIDLEALR